MDAFNYLSVMISLILGLAITQVLQGFRTLIQARSRIALYWPAIVWSVLVIVMAMQSWWAMFGLRAHRDWTFLEFSAVLLQTIVMYLLAALVLPDVERDATVDLRAHYLGHRRWFFLLLVGLMASSLLKQLVVDGELAPPVDLAFHGVFALGGVAGAISARPRLHAFLALFGVVTLGVYIALLFAHLR